MSWWPHRNPALPHGCREQGRAVLWFPVGCHHRSEQSPTGLEQERSWCGARHTPRRPREQLFQRPSSICSICRKAVAQETQKHRAPQHSYSEAHTSLLLGTPRVSWLNRDVWGGTSGRDTALESSALSVRTPRPHHSLPSTGSIPGAKSTCPHQPAPCCPYDSPLPAPTMQLELWRQPPRLASFRVTRTCVCPCLWTATAGARLPGCVFNECFNINLQTEDRLVPAEPRFSTSASAPLLLKDLGLS